LTLSPIFDCDMGSYSQPQNIYIRVNSQIKEALIASDYSIEII